ncbi:MAG: cell division protein FtsZ [Candidatus Paracaedibacteraceae bacterium]|nr:cell division protein FtsZ [Candidatus Paracaedibacteraceae bacterium]
MEEQLTLDAKNKAIESLHELKPRITVIGVGGAGGNAVNNMIRYQLEGVDFITANTDAQALAHSLAPHRIQLGLEITQGLGAGSRPDVGKAAAEETAAEVMGHIKGSHMVFITAGMGGGTGTGAAPVIAKAAREAGILTVGVVTKPFHFEGSHRMKSAEQGIVELQQYVDTLIVIPNQNLFRIANERTTFSDAFKMADDVLYSGVRGVTDLMIMPGLINLDFADIRSVMGEMGKAMMGTGEAEGENRAVEAAEAAISNPLLDDVSMRGAKGVLINITGGFDMTLFEVDEAANRIRQEVDPEANIIFGSTFDEKMEGIIRVSVVATGIDAELGSQRKSATQGMPHSFGPTFPSHIDIAQANASQGEALGTEEFDDILKADNVTQSASDGVKKLSEDEDSFDLSQPTEPYRAIPRKLSFFERLTGRRRSTAVEEEHFFDSQNSSRSKPKIRADEDLSIDEAEELEIPAFLRRKK